jgi:hypothetical protein
MYTIPFAAEAKSIQNDEKGATKTWAKDSSPRFSLNQSKEGVAGLNTKASQNMPHDSSKEASPRFSVAGKNEKLPSARGVMREKSTPASTAHVVENESPRFSLLTPNSKAVKEATPRFSVENEAEDSQRRKLGRDLPAIDVAKVLPASSNVEDKDSSAKGRLPNQKSVFANELKRTISPRISLEQGPVAGSLDSESFEIKPPARSAPQLVNKSPQEVAIKWDPWIVTPSTRAQSVQMEYGVDWKEGRGTGGQWNSFPSPFTVCEARKKNLSSSTWYSFRVRARQVILSIVALSLV